jgi:hypothetical protein
MELVQNTTSPDFRDSVTTDYNKSDQSVLRHQQACIFNVHSLLDFAPHSNGKKLRFQRNFSNFYHFHTAHYPEEYNE